MICLTMNLKNAPLDSLIGHRVITGTEDSNSVGLFYFLAFLSPCYAPPFRCVPVKHLDIRTANFSRRISRPFGVSTIPSGRHDKISFYGAKVLSHKKSILKDHKIKEEENRRKRKIMAMSCGLTLYLINRVMEYLHQWISSCLLIADEIARAIRRGEIGPFPIG